LETDSKNAFPYATVGCDDSTSGSEVHVWSKPQHTNTLDHLTVTENAHCFQM